MKPFDEHFEHRLLDHFAYDTRTDDGYGPDIRASATVAPVRSPTSDNECSSASNASRIPACRTVCSTTGLGTVCYARSSKKRQRMRDRPAWTAARHRNAMSRWAYDRTRTHSTPAFEGGPETRFGPRPERPAERRIQAGLRPGYPSPPSTRTRGRRRTDGMRGMFHDGGSRVHEPMRMLRKTRLRRLCSSERIRRTNLLPMLGR